MSRHQKILYLVRHAKSSWKDPSLSDRDRPLNKRGRRSAPDMGQRLARQGHKPDLMISSPAKRACSTAKKIATELGYDPAAILTDENLYFSSIVNMCSALEGLEDHYQKVMMFGHNPAMTSLLNALTDSSVFNMPTCAVAVIGFDIESWSELISTNGELLGYDYPKGPENFIDGLDYL
jgi:phosphohistidine phosphatase